MIQYLYAVEDVKAELFRSFFVEDSDAAATRSFAQLANNEQTSVAQYPDDFRLVRLALVDAKTGEVMPKKENLGFASQFVKPKEVARG